MPFAHVLGLMRALVSSESQRTEEVASEEKGEKSCTQQYYHKPGSREVLNTPRSSDLLEHLVLKDHTSLWLFL